MGVRHLEQFMKTCVPDGFLKVNLLDEINKYPIEHNGEKPMIVIDLMGFKHIIYKSFVDLFYVGRHLGYIERLDVMFQKITSAGAEIVGFTDGAWMDTKVDTCLSRYDFNFDLALQILDFVYKKVPVEYMKEKFKEIPTVGSRIRIINEKIREYGTFFTSVFRECDTEIAKFASTNNNVLAIIADDPDFLIFPGKWRYFSIKCMDFETLDTQEYNRKALRSCLQLNDSQLVLLSTIAGNDIVTYEEVKSFHRHQCQGHQIAHKFSGIANYIRTKLTGNFEQQIKHIAKYIVRNTDWKMLSRINESFELYNINYDEEPSPIHPLHKYCLEENIEIYFMLYGKISNFSEVFSDLRRSDAQSYVEIILPLFQRQNGVVMNHLRPAIGNILVPYSIKKSLEEHYQVYQTAPTYPYFDISPLLNILKREEFPELDSERFRILKWMICDDLLEQHDVNKIPKEYLVDILALVYLKHCGVITAHEADIFLLSVRCVEKAPIPEELLYSPVLDERAFVLAFMYAKVFYRIQIALDITGLKYISKQFNFDGVYFHFLYGQFSDNKIRLNEMLEDLSEYRLYRD